MRWAERQKNWLSDPATYPLIAILGATGVFVTGFIGYFTITAPDVQISPLKRYVYICFVSISIVLTAFDTFCLGWLGLAHFGSIDLMNVFFCSYLIPSLGHSLGTKLCVTGNKHSLGVVNLCISCGGIMVID